MPIVYNDLPRIYEVKYNDTNLQKVKYNGTLVFDRRLKVTYSITISYRLECDYEDAYAGCLSVSYPRVALQIEQFEITFYDPQLISEVILKRVEVNYTADTPTIGGIEGVGYSCLNDGVVWHWSDERKNWGGVCAIRRFRHTRGGMGYDEYLPILSVSSDEEDIYPIGPLKHGQGSYMPKFSFTIQVTGKGVSGSNITFSQEITHVRTIQPAINVTRDNWNSSFISGYTQKAIAQSYGWEK